MSEKAEPKLELVEGNHWILVAPDGHFLRKAVCEWRDDGALRTVVNFWVEEKEEDE